MKAMTSEKKSILTIHTFSTLWFLILFISTAYYGWMPEPWFTLNEASKVVSMVCAIALCSGPLLSLITVHPYQTKHWKRDLCGIVLIQTVLTLFVASSLWVSRPEVVLWISNDVVSLEHDEIKNDQSNWQITPKYAVLKTKNAKELYDPKEWEEMEKGFLKGASKWDLNKMSWDTPEQLKKWEVFKKENPNYKNWTFFALYGKSKSGWWVWDAESGTPITMLDLPAPLHIQGEKK